ncbi:hypothetical protein QBZ16_000965 [Prototheca wickerhamii]|uniref:Uncharacterized protein n=1 Tax=Prototheca wickerhamii TaxID=3111 RepID=A0AAD9MJF0_PROWI|nr:hypothetical protein QBZ16_000965 [Prototheca wickerhamii]
MADFDPTVHDAEGLRERLAASGALDALREDALRQLREHKGLRKFVEDKAQAAIPDLVRKGADSKRKLFDELRRQLEPEVVTKGLEYYAEVLSSSAFPWSALMEAELESCLCQWADEVIAEQAADG